MTAINGIAQHERPEDTTDWDFHNQDHVDYPLAERCEELFDLVPAGRLDQTVPATVCDPLALLVLGQAYGPECAVTLAVEHWLALHIHADPDLRDRFAWGAEYTMDRVDQQNNSLLTRPSFAGPVGARLAMAASGVMVCGCWVRFEAVAPTGEPYSHTRRWIRDDPSFGACVGEGFAERLKTCEDCLAFCAGPVAYVDCPSCAGWRDAAIG
ncbi:hypothetical protein [Streptomyces sp. CB01881]|uniref:hypothetical protein n=1 Tax=Streptomyces sp. CB01881 TaxID=2078691 RepID=UPI000CDBBA3F|nr:hypothetical protein [Streptomyces sp. CB01881]AUY48335.1 hypothetical protein C2142_04445 [Streptomyces sp. CB01881]TYC76822.1 hypothetical protein EH183_04460 [Streptomyces sp. CB01881]